MQARVLSWTRLERPPAGFAAGRVIVLVEAADGAGRYALWEGEGDPPMDGLVALVQRGSAWAAG